MIEFLIESHFWVFENEDHSEIYLDNNDGVDGDDFRLNTDMDSEDEDSLC